jgi:hypothetical protein
VAPNAVTAKLIFVAGVLLAFNVRAGIHLLVLPVLVALGRGHHQRLASADENP